MTRVPEIDWELAAATGRRLIKAGPPVNADQAAEVVAALRTASARAEDLVRETAQLQAPKGLAPVLVVDRPTWLRANVDSVRGLFAGASIVPNRLGGKFTGAELGTVLSWLGTKVLGQFDPFHKGVGERGRLLLVAPNVVKAERELHVDVAEFRLWVCLHEETHRVQFTQNNWLADHVRSLALRMIDALDFTSPAIGDIVERIRRGERNLTVLDVIPAGQPRQLIDQISAVMSLLEGHADVIMDRVGPRVIPSVAMIRHRFDARRNGVGLDKLIRRLIGLDVKMAQYRDGARFCRHVIERVGIEEFNRVFTSPNTLPTAAEMSDPQLWVTRMGG